MRISSSLLACLSLLWTANHALAGEPLQITVAIPPIQYFAERIGGKQVQVQSLIGPGQSHHTYEPMPRQMTRLALSKIYFDSGLPFEKTLVGRIQPTFKNVRIVELHRDLIVLPAEAKHASEHHDEEIDPHFWLDPRNAMAMSRVIARTLAETDPDHETLYKTNANILIAEIEKLDRDLGVRLSAHKGKTFYVFHPAFGYFAHRYELKQKALEIEGKEPSAQNLAALIEQARADHAQAILAQPQFPSQAVEALARAIDGVVLRVDPLDKNYPKAMRSIGDAIDKALSRDRK